MKLLLSLLVCVASVTVAAPTNQNVQAQQQTSQSSYRIGVTGAVARLLAGLLGDTGVDFTVQQIVHALDSTQLSEIANTPTSEVVAQNAEILNSLFVKRGENAIEVGLNDEQVSAFKSLLTTVLDTGAGDIISRRGELDRLPLAAIAQLLDQLIGGPHSKNGLFGGILDKRMTQNPPHSDSFEKPAPPASSSGGDNNLADNTVVKKAVAGQQGIDNLLNDFLGPDGPALLDGLLQALLNEKRPQRGVVVR